jgi:hypothetical protein
MFTLTQYQLQAGTSGENRDVYHIQSAIKKL